MRTTYIAKEADIVKKWYVIDAEGVTLGRLASEVANILRGKNKPQYAPNVDMGDYVVIHDTGAHGFSMGYNYNGKLRSAELLLKENGDVQMIRRAETPADYFATFDFTNFFK